VTDHPADATLRLDQAAQTPWWTLMDSEVFTRIREMVREAGYDMTIPRDLIAALLAAAEERERLESDCEKAVSRADRMEDQREEAVSQRDEARARAEAAEKQVNTEVEVVNRLSEQNERLEEALRGYGGHKKWCHYFATGCNCGFDQALTLAAGQQ
jgi:hypothetical protein